MRTRASARQALVRLQGRREHSERELRTKLSQREYTPDAIDDAVAFAQKHDLQNDSRYARSQGRMLSTRKGNRAVTARLAASGVDKATAAQVVEALPDEALRAFSALKRFGGNAVDASMRQKAWRFLTARGFSSGAITTAWRRFERGASEAEEE